MEPSSRHPFVDFLEDRGLLQVTPDQEFAADTDLDSIVVSLAELGGDREELEDARDEYIRIATVLTGGRPAPKPDDARIGCVIGSYRLEAKIGSGGQGSVFLAKHVELGSDVAVKLLTDCTKRDVARMRREAGALSQLKHPNVVGFYDYGQFETVQWLAMEYVDGESAGQRVSRDGPFDGEQVERILDDVLSGLAAAHGIHENSVHRDLSSNNVLLDRSGRALIADFGLARGVVGNDQVTHSVGMIMGTLPYIAPEVFDGQPSTQTSDLWSIGVLAFEFSTGKPPFQGGALELIKAVCETDPPFETLPSKSLRVLAEACLRKDPEERVGSAAEALTLLRHGRPQAAPTSVASRVAGTLVVAVFAAFVWMFGPWHETDGAAPPTPTTPPDRGDGQRPKPAPDPEREAELARQRQALEAWSELVANAHRMLAALRPPDQDALRQLTTDLSATTRPADGDEAPEADLAKLDALLRARASWQAIEGSGVDRDWTTWRRAIADASGLGCVASVMEEFRRLEARTLDEMFRASGTVREATAVESELRATEAAARARGLTFDATLPLAQEADDARRLTAVLAMRFRPSEHPELPTHEPYLQRAQQHLTTLLPPPWIPSGFSSPTREYQAAGSERSLPRTLVHDKSGIHLTLVPMASGHLYVGTTEVTEAEFSKGGGMADSQRAGYPVTDVSFDAAIAFARANGMDLPTLPEWRRACLGSDASRAEFHCPITDLAEFAVFDSDAKQTVRRRSPNSLNLYDMHGNVHEWVQPEPDESAGNQRRYVGGAYNSPADDCSVDAMHRQMRDFRAKTLGFRVVVRVP